ncbi:unnamed protein product [Moneuplotes crassus]|uniref:Uncharacterized protein n=1 Tax=Euplotes crassus TaxID=5936 RepID=A0AAD2D4J7_EUPCR|nr:unnamed protein product [Moneuplotes crassus]
MEVNGGVEQKIRKKEVLIEERVYENMYQNTRMDDIDVLSRDYWSICDESIYFTEFVLKKMRKFKKTKVHTVTVWEYCNEKMFKEFLKASLIKEIPKFWMMFQNAGRFSINQLPNISKYLCLSCCDIDQRQFRKIIQVGRHIEEMKFEWCMIEFRDFKLSKSLHYAIKSIEFTILNSRDKNQQEKYEVEMKQGIQGFVKAASFTDLKQSLKSLKLYNNGKECSIPQWEI